MRLSRGKLSSSGSVSGRSQRAPREPEGPAAPDRREALKRLVGLGLLAATDLGALSACGPPSLPARSRERKLIILGLDALDPETVSRMMAEGKLPSFARLRAMGGFRSLGTTIPPQSPVAWATFSTGRDPGGHGVYDFIHRNAATYEFMNGAARTAPPSLTIPVGEWRVPLSSSRVEHVREGPAFWDMLARRGVPCEAYRAPSNFPPDDTPAKQLSGLGTPDLRGTNGTCAYYTTDQATTVRESARASVYSVRLRNGHFTGRLPGPRNSLRSGHPTATVRFEVYADAARRVAKIVLQGTEVILREGEWSDWVPVVFTMVPHAKSVSGILRFYLKQAVPHFKLYASPVNFDPMNPALPISSPRGFSRELAERLGRFHTMGLPQDTAALEAGILDDDDYLHQSHLIWTEARRLYEDALNRFERGLLFFYFSTPDRTQHMFWRTMDARHPAYDRRAARDHGPAIERCYEACDEVVAEALEASDRDTTLLVLSDHGFAPYYREFNLNTWLRENGYLQLMRGASGASSYLRDVDWSRTAAYALGLNSVYVNLRGREGRGIVAPEQREAVVRRLAQELRKARDPVGGERIVRNAYVADDVYSGPRRAETPDIVVGYGPGYRCSTASALGVVRPNTVEDNTGKWSGDHCIDPSVVPGIVVGSKLIAAESPGLADVTATALAEFGVEAPEQFSGRPIW